MEIDKTKLAFTSQELSVAILSHSELIHVSKGTELIRSNQHITSLPLVISGIVKVFSKYEERDILLYYLKANESCVMSFASCLQNSPSRIYAAAETDCKILLLPSSKLKIWLKEYPELNDLFYEQYDKRYLDLLHTIEEIVVNKIDTRTLSYLVSKSQLLGSNIIKESHNQIASELGTVREVITRTLKKLEIDNKISQSKEGIKLLV